MSLRHLALPMTRSVLVVCGTLLLATPAFAGGAPALPAAVSATHAAPAVPAELRVALTGSAPFLLDVGGAPAGIAFDLWTRVAEAIGRPFHVERFENATAALEAVALGRADVAVGPISATAARAEAVAFTQPFFQAQLGIAAPEVTPGLGARLRPFVSGGFLGGLAVLLLVLVGVGAALWWVERDPAVGEDFPADPVRGVGVGVWLALVTMTTVGYGDKVPRTPRGRAIAGAWMLISMISVSSLTAFLATAATLAGLERTAVQTADDLHGRRVAVVSGTTGADFTRRHGGRQVVRPTLDAALDAVAAGEADAVVFDRPALRWRLGQRERVRLGLSPHGYDPVGYAFAVRAVRHGGDRALRDRLDAAMLGLAERGATAAIVERWLGRSDR